MTSIHLLALLTSLLLLLGCPNSSGTLLPDDDDVSDDDDDDVTGGDDDDNDDDDDDDDDVSDDDDTDPGACSDVGEGGIYFDPGTEDPDGMVLEGELGWNGEFLTVSPQGGPSYGLQILAAPDVDLDALMDGISGPGRFYLVSLAGGAWTSYGVMAAFTADGEHAVVLGTTGFPGLGGDFFGFYLSVEPQEGACPDGLIDIGGCGMGAALPLEVTLPGEDSPSTLVWPGEAAEIGEFDFRQYSGYQVFEVLCDDFDERGMSWSLVKP